MTDEVEGMGEVSNDGVNSSGDSSDPSTIFAAIKEKALSKGTSKKGQSQPKKKPDVRALSKLSLPLTLNQYFGQYITNVQNCLIFLERFVGDD